MNLENFAEYLKYPSRLYQLPYEELKSLTLQYPYCGNFHVLLLLKSKLEAHPDLEKNLAKAATYSVDRKFIRQLMQQDQLLRVASQFTIGEDEVLELKDLFSLEGEWEKIPLELSKEPAQQNTALPIYFDLHDEEDPEEEPLLPMAGPAEGTISVTDPFPESPAESFSEPQVPIAEEVVIVPEDVVDSADAGIPDAAAAPALFYPAAELLDHHSTMISLVQNLEPAPVAIALPSATVAPVEEAFEIPEAVIEGCIAVGLALDDWWDQQVQAQTVEWEIPKPVVKTPAIAVLPPPVPKIQIAPTPKAKFKSYRKGYRQPMIKEASIELPEARPPFIATAPEARQVARASVREDLEIASETLAGLLVQQEQYDRAIKMYEHLSLLIPEKNTYFAAKIDAIKNL